MAKIFVSLAGEGRGHATRVRALVERLRGPHEVVLFASHVAHQLLAAAYRGQPHVTVRRIPAAPSRSLAKSPGTLGTKSC